MLAEKPLDLPYRPCVGIMLINRAGLVWVGRRRPKWAGYGSAHIWQMPQGGITPGEGERAAALRELEEETGVASVELLAEAPDWLSYDLPPDLLGIALKGRYRGQRQKWFAMRFTGKEFGDRRRPARWPQGRVRRLALGRRRGAAAPHRALQAAGLLRRRAGVCGLCRVGAGSAASFRRCGKAWS